MFSILNLFNYQENIFNLYKTMDMDIDDIYLRKMIVLYTITN